MPSTTQGVELELIKTDVGFYVDLMSLLSRKSSSIFIFGLIPYLSLFTIETYQYLRKFFPPYAYSLSNTNGAIIESSRMRIKFFDDSEKRVTGILELLRWVFEFSTEWHVNRHKGFLGPILRALQDDLGIFTYDGHIIGSTHTGLLNLGYEKADLPSTSEEISITLGPSSTSVAYELGSYLKQLSQYPEFAPSDSDKKNFTYNLQDEKLGHISAKSPKIFASIFDGNGVQEINLSLLHFLVTINFLYYVLGRIPVGSSETLFKLKFITLYHLASSLEKLQQFCYPQNLLTQKSNQYFHAILQDDDLTLIKRQSKFRNILTHYGIIGVSNKDLIPSARLYGLVEYFFEGRTYTEIDEKLDGQIARISMLLEEWFNRRIMKNLLAGRRAL